jgi:hypothetical protein
MRRIQHAVHRIGGWPRAQASRRTTRTAAAAMISAA